MIPGAVQISRISRNGRNVQGCGVLAMRINTVRRIFWVGGLCLFGGCSTGNSAGFPVMSDQKAFDQRQSEELVAFMSLEQLFPDRRLRALARAAGAGDTDEVDRLVREGVDVNGRGRSGGTPMFWAMKRGNLAGFRKLAELGADPNSIFDDGGTVVHWAVRLEDRRFLQTALDYGGNPNLVSGHMDHTPLFITIGSGGDGDVAALRLLLESGADPDARDSRGNTPAMIAAGIGRFDIVHELLRSGASVELKNHAGVGLLDRVVAKRGAFVRGSNQERSLGEVIDWLRARGFEVPDERR